MLDPVLWNILFDAMLMLLNHADTKTISLAGNVAVLIVSKYLENVT